MANLLIDTHILLWVQENNPALSESIKKHIQDPAHVKWVSQISFIEIAIKLKIGKLPSFRVSVDEIIQQALLDGFNLLPIRNYHIAAYDKIPLHEQHRDPFDRLLLSTALSENWPLISADEKFQLYRNVVNIIW